MASDNRDWYRDWWRKKTGYQENAAFRLGHHEVERRKFASAWRRNVSVVLLVVLFAVLIWMLLNVRGL